MWESNPTCAAWKAAAQPLGQSRGNPHRNTRRSTQDLDTFGLGTCTGRLLPGCLSFPPLELFGDRRGPLSLAGASVRDEGAHIFPSGQEVQSVLALASADQDPQTRRGSAPLQSPQPRLAPSAVFTQGAGLASLLCDQTQALICPPLGALHPGWISCFMSLACVAILASGWVSAMAGMPPDLQTPA